MTEHTRPRSFQSQDLARYFDATRLAPRQAHKALSVWPLIRDAEAIDPDSGAPPYVAVADAIAAGHFQLEEVSDQGSVPNVAAENSGDVAVLVLFGEELRGAKQNRIANASFLIGAHSRVVLDVSCVEQGRWARRSAGFEASGAVFSSASRRKMARRVTASRDAGRGFDADQGEVWDEVRTKLNRSGTRSETRAYADHLAVRGRELDEIARAFSPLAEQVGFVASLGDCVAGVEVVGRPAVFARAFRGLLGSYLIDALDGPGEAARDEREPSPGLAAKGGVRFEAPEPFLEAVSNTAATAGPSLGLGEDLRLRGRGVAGCALFAGDVVHLTAFPEPVNPRWA